MWLLRVTAVAIAPKKLDGLGPASTPGLHDGLPQGEPVTPCCKQLVNRLSAQSEAISDLDLIAGFNDHSARHLVAKVFEEHAGEGCIEPDYEQFRVSVEPIEPNRIGPVAGMVASVKSRDVELPVVDVVFEDLDYRFKCHVSMVRLGPDRGYGPTDPSTKVDSPT